MYFVNLQNCRLFYECMQIRWKEIKDLNTKENMKKKWDQINDHM
jgi:hypothetical protein